MSALLESISGLKILESFGVEGNHKGISFNKNSTKLDIGRELMYLLDNKSVTWKEVENIAKDFGIENIAEFKYDPDFDG